MSLVSDNYATGDLSKAGGTIGVPPTIVTSPVYNGNKYAMHCVGPTSCAWYDWSPQSPIAAVETLLYLNDLPKSGEVLALNEVYDSAGNEQVGVNIENVNGVLNWVLESPSGKIYIPATIVTGQFYDVIIAAEQGNGNGVTMLLVNGVLLASNTTETIPNITSYAYIGIVSSNTVSTPDIVVGQLNITAQLPQTTPVPPTQITLTIEESTGGSTSPAAGTYPYSSGVSVPVTATSSLGYEFIYWLLDDVDVGSANPYTIVMDASHTLTPVFVLTSTPTPPSGTIVPNSVLGDDYLIYWNYNGDPANSWGSNGFLNYFTRYKCTVARLSFTFPDCPGAGAAGSASTYVYSKMNTVLNYLASVGVKAILCDWTNANITSGWYGSQAWVNDWINLTSAFAGDTRIAGFQPCNEPYSPTLSPTGPTGGITDMHSFDVAMAYLIGKIRAIDPTRKIVYPLVDVIFTDDATAFYNDLVSTGVTAYGNILYDIVHPYYMEDANDLGMTPTQKASWYWTNYCLPQIAYFGVENCWCGETFPFPSDDYIDGDSALGYYNYDEQQQFEIAMINYFVAAGMGFQMWLFFTAIGHPDQADINALNSSDYVTGVPAPVQYTLTIASAIGGSTSPAGTYTETSGTVIQVTATPNSGYTFSDWLLDGVNVGSANPYSVTMNENHILTPVFAAIPPPTPTTISLNVVAGADGSVTPSGLQTLTIGQTYSFGATSDSDYAFDHWDLSGTDVGTANPLSFVAALSMNGETLTAMFVETVISLTVVSGDDGSVNPSGAVPLNIGQAYAFNATPDPDYQLDHWDLSGTSLGSSNPLTLTATAAMNGEVLTAMFTSIPPTPPQTVNVTLAASAGGTTNPAPGSQTFNIGDIVTLTALADSGFVFVNWTLNGTAYSNDSTLELPITSGLNGATLTANFASTSKTSTSPGNAAALALGSAGLIALVTVIA